MLSLQGRTTLAVDKPNAAERHVLSFQLEACTGVPPNISPTSSPTKVSRMLHGPVCTCLATMQAIQLEIKKGMKFSHGCQGPNIAPSPPCVYLQRKIHKKRHPGPFCVAAAATFPPIQALEPKPQTQPI